MAYINNKFGSCLRGVKNCIKNLKNSDYEFVSYEKQVDAVKSAKPQRPERKRDFTRFESKSSNDLQQLQLELRNQMYNSNKEIETISKNHIHSSTIYFEDDDSIYYSALDLVSNKQNKISSTVLNNVTFKPDVSQMSNTSDSQAFNNQAYNSPCLKRTKSITSFETAVDEFEFTNYQSYGYKTSQMDSINSGLFLETTDNQVNQISDQLYVCVSSYKAINQGDLTLNYADRVILLHSINGMSLVQNASTKQCGYVPSETISSLDMFLY